MIIKGSYQSRTYLDLFDIMDSSKKETNLAKFLAFIISKNPYAMKKVIDLIDGADGVLKGKKTELILKNTSVEIEKHYSGDELGNKVKHGRTDIEIKVFDNYDDSIIKLFIIIECKVHNNKASYLQFEKYKNVFKLGSNNTAEKKYFVYLSNQSGINLLGDDDIKQVDLNWRELINSLYDVKFIDHSSQINLKNFMNYYERSYGMSNQKEILIQDIGFKREVDRFFNNIYRRNKVNGSPLYFAPYFTKNSNRQGEGITHISKILGIITTNNISWKKIEGSCEKFVDLFDKKCTFKQDLLSKWRKEIDEDEIFFSSIDKQKEKLGEMLEKKIHDLENHKVSKYAQSKITLDKEIEDIETTLNANDDVILSYWKEAVYTYYFLNDSLKLSTPLLKDGGIEKGRGKNWIAASIPPNRCVSFSDFLSHTSLINESTED